MPPAVSAYIAKVDLYYDNPASGVMPLLAYKAGTRLTARMLAQNPAWQSQVDPEGGQPETAAAPPAKPEGEPPAVHSRPGHPPRAAQAGKADPA